MDAKELENLRGRTDAKIRYAQVHLSELQAVHRLGGDDFDRAHQESFLYHLLGAKEAFVIELNTYYSIGLSNDGLTAGKLREALKAKGKVSKELAELYSLENDPSSWLSFAKDVRDYSTHISGQVATSIWAVHKMDKFGFGIPKLGKVLKDILLTNLVIGF